MVQTAVQSPGEWHCCWRAEWSARLRRSIRWLIQLLERCDLTLGNLMRLELMSREIIERFFSLFLKQSVKRTFLCRIAAALDWPVLAPWCVSVAISLPRKLRLLN